MLYYNSMSFIDNLRDALSLENIKRAREFIDSMKSKQKEPIIIPRIRELAQEERDNSMPADWHKREFFFDTGEIGEGGIPNFKYGGTVFFDENNVPISMDTPMQSYELNYNPEDPNDFYSNYFKQYEHDDGTRDYVFTAPIYNRSPFKKHKS